MQAFLRELNWPNSLERPRSDATTTVGDLAEWQEVSGPPRGARPVAAFLSQIDWRNAEPERPTRDSRRPAAAVDNRVENALAGFNWQ